MVDTTTKQKAIQLNTIILCLTLFFSEKNAKINANAIIKYKNKNIFIILLPFYLDFIVVLLNEPK